jgi:triphosphoribosyl-dephospho-CoA synthetase
MDSPARNNQRPVTGPTPKPGAVDARDNGSHGDMNLAMLVASANSLRHAFTRYRSPKSGTGTARKRSKRYSGTWTER